MVWLLGMNRISTYNKEGGRHLDFSSLGMQKGNGVPPSPHLPSQDNSPDKFTLK